MKQYCLKFSRIFKLTFGLHEKVYFNDLNRILSIGSKFGTDRGLLIDRYSIEIFLKKSKKHVKGRILEIAEDTYFRKFADYSSSKEHQILKLCLIKIRI